MYTCKPGGIGRPVSLFLVTKYQNEPSSTCSPVYMRCAHNANKINMCNKYK